MIKTILEVSKISPKRSRYDVLSHLVEEVGELSTEVSIREGGSYKESGVDGVQGEAVDVIINCIDLIWVDNPSITEEEIMDNIRLKLKKWKSKLIIKYVA